MHRESVQLLKRVREQARPVEQEPQRQLEANSGRRPPAVQQAPVLHLARSVLRCSEAADPAPVPVPMDRETGAQLSRARLHLPVWLVRPGGRVCRAQSSGKPRSREALQVRRRVWKAGWVACSPSQSRSLTFNAGPLMAYVRRETLAQTASLLKCNTGSYYATPILRNNAERCSMTRLHSIAIAHAAAKERS